MEHLPAPLWFIQLFKIVGFVLHMIPMGLWFAGLPVAIGCAIWNCKHSSRFARRMFGQFPIIMALGINFGIVPLLFLQTAYYKSFYTATILTAWHWLAVIPILIVGYYSLYLAAYSRQSNKRMIGFGVLASLCLIAIGILITNGMTLMVRSDLWPDIMERTGIYGATTGLANNMRDPALWLRLATMFALGLSTTAVWAAFDSHFLLKNISRNEPWTTLSAPGTLPEDRVDELTAYRRWTISLAILLSWVGLATILALELLVDDTILKATYPHITKLLVPICLLFMVLSYGWSGKTRTSYLIVAATLIQLATLATFAVMRQRGQNAGVAAYADITKIPENVQWSPLIAFLVCFALGLLVIVWMVKQAVAVTSDE